MSQKSAYDSPWSVYIRAKVFLWNLVWLLFFRPTPKYFISWRNFLLGLFGCKISGKPFVSQSAVIKMPWNLTLQDRACLGPKSEVYNLGKVTLKSRSTVSQYAYLCGGTHDFSSSVLPLVIGDIIVGEDAFIGAHAFIMPGIRVGDGAVIGACSVVTKDMPDWTICAGNPCKPISTRTLDKQEN